MNNIEMNHSNGYFANENLSNDYLTQIAEHIKSGNCLFHNLNLSNCQIDDAKLVILLPVLIYKNHKIKSLNLSNNQLSSNITLCLVEHFLWHDSSITEIDLRGNNINSKTKCFINFILHVNYQKLATYFDVNNFLLSEQDIIH